MQHLKCVFRSFAIPAPMFDHLKDFQRTYEKAHGVKITNNHALSIILGEHQRQQVAQVGG